MGEMGLWGRSGLELIQLAKSARIAVSGGLFPAS
jgi:hypothetical protein